MMLLLYIPNHFIVLTHFGETTNRTCTPGPHEKAVIINLLAADTNNIVPLKQTCFNARACKSEVAGSSFTHTALLELPGA